MTMQQVDASKRRRVGWGLLLTAARVRASIKTKLLAAFLAIVGLMIALSAVGLWSLQQANERTADLVRLERQISAYRQLQHNTTAQLYATASAFLAEDKRDLDTASRQLQRLAYDFDRANYITDRDPDLQERVQMDYRRFIELASEIIETIRASYLENNLAGAAAVAVNQIHNVYALQEAQRKHHDELAPLASKLERNIYTLANLAEADMVDHADRSAAAYRASLYGFVTAALASVMLALLLGYTISSSLIDPIRAIRGRLRAIAQGEFEGAIEVSNRDELGDLSESVNRMSEQLARLYGELEAANRHKSAFLANMSHELRTPMNAIIGFNRLVMRRCKEILPEKQYDNLGKIAVSADHLLTLINGVLDLSKIEAGRIDVHTAKFPLAPMLDGCARTVEPLAEGKRLTIRTDLDLNGELILSDQEKLRQIVLNLLGNACKFTDEGEVRLSARIRGETAEIAVSDTGIGIPVDKLTAVFEEFTQVDDGSTRRYAGTGLGLAISQRLAGLLGGRIEVESTEGRGSIFTLKIPVRLDPQARDAA